MRVTIFDYGAGNLHSLAKALDVPGVRVGIEADPVRAIDTDALVLPGVGAFGPAATCLARGRDAMRAALDAGLPCLGICLGMQLLFESSEEAGPAHRGLAVVPGHVDRLRAVRVPQIGWNALEDAHDPLLDSAPLAVAYYANGFVCRPDDPSVVRAWSTHEQDRFAAVVRRGRTVGVQFHPEKSSREGVRFLHAFLDEARA